MVPPPDVSAVPGSVRGVRGVGVEIVAETAAVGDQRETIWPLLFELGRVFEELLLRVDDLNSMNERCETALRLAAAGGNEDIVQMLLGRQEEVHVNRMNYFDRTPLSMVVEKGHLNVARMVLQLRAVGVHVPINRQTPLCSAARLGQVEAVRVLLETGRVVVDSRDSADETPLSLAAPRGRADSAAARCGRQQHGHRWPHPALPRGDGRPWESRGSSARERRH